MKTITRLILACSVGAMIISTSKAQERSSDYGTPIPTNYKGIPFPLRANKLDITNPIEAWMFDSTATASPLDSVTDTWVAGRVLNYDHKVNWNSSTTVAARMNTWMVVEKFNGSGWMLGGFGAGVRGNSMARYTYSVQDSGNYSMTFSFISGASAAPPDDSITIEFDFGKGATAGTDTNDAERHRVLAHGWGAPVFDTVLIKNVHLAAGQHVLTMTNYSPNVHDNGDIDIEKLTFSKVIPGGINELNRNNLDITIYPTACKDYINLRVEGAKSINKANVFITDLTGQVVYNKNYSDMNYAAINTSGFSNGVYFITILNEKNSITKKFIKY